MKELFEQMLLLMQSGEPCMLVSAVGGEGSAPRKTESHMLVSCKGRLCGTVGGGAVEGNSIVYAAELLKSRSSVIKTFELFAQAKDNIGMICGGRVTVHYKYVSPEDTYMQKLAQNALSALSDGKNAWLIICLSDHTLSLYQKEAADNASVSQPVVAALGPCAMRMEAEGREYYAEQLSFADKVYVFGGGHVSQALVPVLSSVGFRCVVIEDREEFCQRSLFPQAQELLLLEEQDWVRMLPITKDDCICIMTRGHKNDLKCQAFALDTQAGYIGVIGSRSKIAAVNAQLAAMGFSDEQIARITTPIGLDIGAITPAEIAVSIAAQMIAHRAKRRHAKKSCMA